MKEFEKNYVICIHDENRETLETKILKSKDPRMESWGIRENGISRGEKRKRIILGHLKSIRGFLSLDVC